MKLSDFDFELPPERIALRPARPRSAAKMLVADESRLHDSRVSALPDWLRSGDILVLNDTKVIPARLRGARLRGDLRATIEVTLIERVDGRRWRALARPAKKLRLDDRLEFAGELTARVTEAPQEGRVLLEFNLEAAALDAAIAGAGEMPLPPYIAARRPADAQDADDYQTVFAANPGAVAAPTAALHFDADLLARLRARGLKFAHITLHVGAGTFLPVKTDNVDAHAMHSEWGEISADAAEAINAAKCAGGRVIAVGTTALRLLETAAQPSGLAAPWRGHTDIFIRPGFRFKLADGLMTNFHLPRSTLFMLVCAFMGAETMRKAYGHAIERDYRFYSYGDSSLLFRAACNSG